MPEHNLLDRSNSARKAFKILRRLLSEFDGTNDTVIEPTGVERELTGVIIDFPQNTLGRKVIPDRVRRIVDSGIAQPIENEDEKPINVINQEGLPLPEYVRVRAAQDEQQAAEKLVEKPVEVEVTEVDGKIINPEGKSLPEFMAELVEKRKQQKLSRIKEKAA